MPPATKKRENKAFSLGHFGQERRSSAHGDFDDELHANVLLCVSLEEQFQYSTLGEEFRPLFVPFLSPFCPAGEKEKHLQSQVLFSGVDEWT